MRKVFSILLLLLCYIALTAQDSSLIHIQKIPELGILLDKGWKFKAGDDPTYTNPKYNDQNWELVNPTLDIYDVPEMWNRSVGWLRIHFRVNNNLLNKPLAFQVRQHVASEIYINGVLLKQYGVVSTNPHLIRAFQPRNEPFNVQFTSPEQVVAVRFSYQPLSLYTSFVPPFNGFMLRINRVEGATAYVLYERRYYKFNYIEGAFFLLLFLIHLSFFIVYPKQKANLYFALSTFSIGIGNLLYVVVNTSHDIVFITKASVIDWILFWSCYGFFLFLALHTLFATKKGIIFWFIVSLFPLGIPLVFISYKWGYTIGMLTPILISIIEAFRLSLNEYKKGKRGVSIVIIGLFSYFISFLLFHLLYYGVLQNYPFNEEYSLKDLLYHLSAVAIPFTLSIYLSLQYAYTTKDLEKKLAEVQQLSEKTLLQEQEKQQILASQKEVLQKQVAERTAELQKSLYELKATQSQLIQSEKMASLGELTAGIAHEIQNPLNFVNNFSETNKELVEEAELEFKTGNQEEGFFILTTIKENEEKIAYHGKRADAIVKNMLEHSRISKGEKQPTDINVLIDEYLRLSYHGFRAKDKSFNAIIETSFDDSIGKINIVPQDIGRLLLNLFNNAFYVVHEKKKRLVNGYEPAATVTTKKLQESIQISVRDNGSGIPQPIIDKIFQPFFTTKPTGEGTGLGLSLSYDIVKAHGGELKVESREGDGTTFTVTLPCV